MNSKIIQHSEVILFTAVYLTFGWINAHDVKRTAYTVHTDKPIAGSARS